MFKVISLPRFMKLNMFNHHFLLLKMDVARFQMLPWHQQPRGLTVLRQGLTCQLPCRQNISIPTAWGQDRSGPDPACDFQSDFWRLTASHGSTIFDFVNCTRALVVPQSMPLWKLQVLQAGCKMHQAVQSLTRSSHPELVQDVQAVGA